ncbi:unnamed protein product [Closterium sp. Yama58-4]|nr:unnamed protein product [Closterium sp. Yama58-4]
MKLSQVLSQAHATAGYNRNKFLVFALLCTNCFTLVTLYGTVPRFSGTLDIDDAADVDLRSSRGSGGGSAWGEEGESALEGKQGKTPALRLSNATDRTFKRGFGMQGFVYFSAYRISASLFVVIGLSPLPLHRNLDARVCRWYPATSSSSSPILGEISIEYPGESHGKPYEVAMLFCQLSSPTPSMRGRGGRKGEGQQSAGGHLTVVIEREEILVLGEPANEKLPLEPSAPYTSNITYCSSPIYGQFNSLRVLEWVVYHQQGHGVDLFHMYDAGGMGEPIMRTLGPFIREGQMTVTDVTEVDEFETWFGQVLVVNDCAYRSLFTSRWVLFLDLDEYLYVSEPLGSSLITALARYDQAAYVSFGSLYFYTDKCSHSMNVSASSPTRWEVERMIFRQADVHCVAPKRYESRDLCLGFDGHRKYVADPRRVKLFGVSHEGSGRGFRVYFGAGRQVGGGVERTIFRQANVHCVAPKRYESRDMCLGFDGHRKYVADPRKGGGWEVEMMIFRQADVHCVAPKRYESRDMCLGFDGHRKYVADPRRVKLFGVSGKGRCFRASQQGFTLGNLSGREAGGMGGGDDDIPPG